MRIAVVTGASSGLGREYIKEINRLETDIDEIWAVARRRERLVSLGESSRIPVRAFPLDLTKKESIEEFKAALERERPDAAILINAAGFGKIGDFSSMDLGESDRMIELNCRAAVDMTYVCLPYMKAGARIMEICSTAGFQPFQYLSVYAASKAFLYRFTRALRVELFSRRIKVTAVCPYWIKDTEFIPTAKDTFGGGHAVRHFPLASHVRSVAAVSYNDSRIGLPVSAPGVVCFVHRIVAKFVPSELMMGIWELLRRA
ncbi:MAG: SDR family NAD(P)-dependent oxidoreductase [Clostridia bacterium]|nr:SDR family NAD(P)-dependent oxidoreductase [Clostridia bacterium]